MSIEAIAAAGSGAMMPPQAELVQAGPGASLNDFTNFQGSMTAAAQGVGAIGGPDALSPALKSVFQQLENVNGQAKGLSDYASSAQASGAEMSPGEVINLTMKTHEFMFNCQLTSNIANRTSDGIQQLFRQQS